MISEFFTDDELLSQLRMFFSDEEQEHLDFQSLLGQLVDVDEDTLELKIKERCFRIDKILCDVEEVV